MDNKKDDNKLVSLPGAGGTEQTIIEVLNRNIASSESEATTQQSQLPPLEGVIAENQRSNRDTEKSPASQLETKNETDDSKSGNLNADRENILEFESHLIDNVNDNHEDRKTVGSGILVEELCPEIDEFSTTSSAETESSTRTVLEVQQPSPLLLLKETENDKNTKEKYNEIDIISDIQQPLDSKNSDSEKLEDKQLYESKNITLEKDNLAESQSLIFSTVNSSVKSEGQIGEAGEGVETKYPKTLLETDLDEVFAEDQQSSIPTETENKIITLSEESNLVVTTLGEKGESVLSSVNFQKQHQYQETETICAEENKENPAITATKLDYQEVTQIRSDEFRIESENNSTDKIKDNNHSVIEQKKSCKNPLDRLIHAVEETQLAYQNISTSEEGQQNIINSSLRLKILQSKTNKLNKNSKSEEEIVSETERQELLDSLPHLDETEATTASKEAKKEYYRYLRDTLNNSSNNRPPVPLETYRWEDLRRAKHQGGYPWTHLYKRPLGPDEEPEIVLLLRKSQEIRHSESPKSLKKVRIHDEVLVKETERYISDLSDNEECPEEDKQSVHSETLSASTSETESKKSRIDKLRGILKRARSPKTEKQDSEKNTSEESSKKPKCCHTFMDKLKTMADKQLKKRNIKKVPLKDNEQIVLSEEQKILKLKISPKADRGEIPHFIEKQDSDEIQEIVELDQSPSKSRKRRQEYESDQEVTSILIPDEIIELPKDDLKADKTSTNDDSIQAIPEPTVVEILKKEFKTTIPPKKAPRRKKEHIYEDIEDDFDELAVQIDEILEEAVANALKMSLAGQDQSLVREMEDKHKHLEELGSSEEDQEKSIGHLAPISSIDSGSSEEERKHTLSPLAEESENENESMKIVEPIKELEIKSALKREPSPSPSDKKVTFSHVEDEAEPHREDVDLPEQFRTVSRWSKISDHVYEPIGVPMEEENEIPPEPSAIPTLEISKSKEIVENEMISSEQKCQASNTSLTSHETKQLRIIETETIEEPTGEDIQRDIEERYFSSIPTTPRSDSRTDNDIHTSQVDSSAIEELPLKAENRKKSFMASAHDRSRKVQQNLRSQAGKIKTKLRGMKKPPSGSPKAKSKERKRFKAPEFSKIKMPEIKRPELPKFKAPEFKRPEFKKIEFKRPEFTKFSRPDMSKFKIPERFSTLKLHRSKSLRETEVSIESTSGTSPEIVTPPKKKFEFNFGTYPRILRKKKEKLSTQVIARADDLPSTETPTSYESSSLPKSSFKGGLVGSKWTDKFSDVSGGDSESGKYQRYESEPESLERMERESSLERRMKEDLDRSTQEEAELEVVQTVEQKQFEDYNEENRAIHEISKYREGEFKQRRPMVHQDSDLVSEESKEVGWTEQDILRNTLLRGTEIDEDRVLAPENYPSEEGLTGSLTITNQETQSTGSSGIMRQKGVLEEIDDDEFFLRKRGISQDNIEIRQYISSAIREGLDTPINALAQLGSSQEYYPDEMDVSNEQVDYGYDIPPPKPRRVKQYSNYSPNIDSAEVSQEFEIERRDSYDDNISLPRTGNDYFKNLPPSRPLRRTKKQYSQESQDQEMPIEDIPYCDDDADEDEDSFYKQKDRRNFEHPQIVSTFYGEKENEDETIPEEPPKAPKRSKKHKQEPSEKDIFVNGFSGRSISNSFLINDNQVEEIIVYRTEHEYIIPLAQAESLTTSVPSPPPRRSRSRSQNSRFTDDDRTSHGADSLISDLHLPDEAKFHVEMKENDGYAVVRKAPPPRPPAPLRRKRSSNSLRDRNFATLPHLKKDQVVPERPTGNFNTMGPTRPPRRKSSVSLGDNQSNVSSPDVTQYEELDDDEIDQTENSRDLQSGDVINKMKYRPLPPPPRPHREGKKHKDKFGNKFDKNGGGEKISSDIQRNGNYDIEKATEKFIEVEVSTQTDPLPDDFVCEEFEITDDMRIIEPRVTKTLEDILKEEQEAELERAKQLADEDSLSRGIQKFRDASQKSFSERSKGSADRSKTSLSRPTTPSIVLVERRVPTPIPNQVNELMLEASLTVRPVADYNMGFEGTGSYRSEEYHEDQTVKSETGASQKEEDERLIDDHRYNTSHVQESSMNVERSVESDKESDLGIDQDGDLGIDQDMTETPPYPPPRKRSSTSVGPRLETEISLVPASQTIEQPQSQSVQEIPSSMFAVEDLDVERLNVNALQAGRIMVSQLHGSSITADELKCKSGNLVVQSLEFPSDLIDQIVERVRTSEREHAQEQNRTTESESKPQSTTPDEPPARPPPPNQTGFPSEYMPYSVPPPSFYQLRNPEDEFQTMPAVRRRRHHRRRDSSSEEDIHRERRRSRQSTRSPEPTIGQLGGQLLNACGTSIRRTMNQMVNILRTSDKEGTDKNISTAILILILMTIGFLLLGITGDKNIHHHHWDYFNPPGNTGRG